MTDDRRSITADQRAAALRRLRRSRQTIALTGAGISTASGIPDFRGAHGLWKNHDLSVYAHIETFRKTPAAVWELALRLRAMAHAAEPNPAHRALAAMEKAGFLHGVITQNIDNLHRRAGSRVVIEYHGSIDRAECPACGTVTTAMGDTPPMCEVCGRIMKPGFTLFGEAVPPAAFLEARNLASYSDLFMVIGTSALVQPAADLPFIAREHGAYIIEMNQGATGLTNYIVDCFIRGPLEETLPSLAAELEARR
jgi:NAD-dependent deacetylase